MKQILFGDQEFVAAGHEDPVNPGVWKKVLLRRDDLQPGRLQMVNWARLPAGNTFAPHYHQDMQEIFIVLSGVARIRVGDEEARLTSGDAVLIDPLEVHQMWNDGQEDVDYIAIGIAGADHGKTILVHS
jgi:mannose-6-phosphate isomerase-like protein (cupin superfamily)